MASTRGSIALAAVLAALLVMPSAAPAAGRSAGTAALQVALRGLHYYRGPVDGIRGPGTRRATRRFQQRRHLRADGIAGRRTRRALGWRGRPSLGRRVLHRGDRGWDVSALQFYLARRGFSSGSIDGGFGSATRRSLIRFQRAAGLRGDGLAGRATIRALRRGVRVHTRRRSVTRAPAPAGPVRFLRPVRAPIGDGFGYPGGRRHDGVDFLAKAGTPAGAAGVGVVTFAGWNDGGYGNLVKIRHRLGYSTWYAHLASITVSPGQAVSGGTIVGYVGATGRVTAPHLHFEAHHNGVPFDPVPLLLP